jgi:hypothetical protein
MTRVLLMVILIVAALAAPLAAEAQQDGKGPPARPVTVSRGGLVASRTDQ